MKCSWEAAFSVVVAPRHLAANAAGVRVGWVVTLPSPLVDLAVGQRRVYVTPRSSRPRDCAHDAQDAWRPARHGMRRSVCLVVTGSV